MKKPGLFRCGLLFMIAMFMSDYVLANEAAPIANLHLMPLPESLTLNAGRLPIGGGFLICVTGHGDSRLAGAVARFLQRLERKAGIPLSSQQIADPNQAALEIHCETPGEQVQSIVADESYTLEVTNRSARLSAISTVGVLRGLETFLQLAERDGQSFFVPALKIEDRPRFRWRGLLIDVSRHWEPIEVIKRNLDAMAALKMNVFHWHLSDDQGFRIESRRFPKLHQMGSDGKYFTQSEVREIVAYARDRGIRVVPEFDMPGHTTAWLVAYPMLASAPGPYKIERSWGVFAPCMDPTRKRVYSFLDSFIGEMAGLFPDEYFHIGGDEVNGKQWNTRSRIRAFKKREHLKDNRELQAYFNQNLLKILGKHGKKMIGWDEIFQPNLPKNIAIQSWRGQASLAESAHQRYAGILSYGYYLDRMQPASFHYAADPLAKEAESLSADEKARILGGEACMWGEFVDPDNIYSRIWPRTAAIAERLWSPAEAKDVRDMYRRLEYVNRDLDSLGLNYRAGYQEKLQQMVGDQSAAPLKALADLLRPAALGVRQRTRRYTSTTPLNRLVDIINPESDAARQFADLVEQALENRSGSSAEFREMRKQMTIWQENDAGLKPMLEQSILLKEIIPLSAAVSGLSKAGIEALDYLASGQKPPDAWRNETAAILEQAEKPQAEILPAIAPPIRRLIEAAMAIQ